TYMLLADAYASKGDTATAKQYIDTYFTKADPEKVTPVQIKMRADIYLATPGQEETAVRFYQDAINADTIQSNKIDMIKKPAASVKTKKIYDKEVIFEQMNLDAKPNPSLTDYFNATFAYYFDSSYGQARDLALKMVEKYPNEIYGYQW